MLENVTKIINNELEAFDINFKKTLTTTVSDFDEVLKYFLSQKSKRIRPIIGILLAKSLGNYTQNQQIFLQAIELIHNATLFHDDVIDEAEIRRNEQSVNKKFSNKIAVLTGDFFLSLAIKQIAKLQNQAIYDILGEYIKSICEGELEQNYAFNKIISIDEYIEKSKKKTALLFKLTTRGIATLSNNSNPKLIAELSEFGENFGVAFQIKDDINNFEANDNKPVLNDLKSGVITAPIIYLAEKEKNTEELLKKSEHEKIIKLLNNSDSIERTKQLVTFYTDIAISKLNNLQDNIYTNCLRNLLS